MGRAGKPEGRITRGTTGVNRLRRVDRWIAALPTLRAADDPLVVDLGYGASATTSNELHERLARVRPDVEVLGIEIDHERVRVEVESGRAEPLPVGVRDEVRELSPGEALEVPLR